MNAAADVATWVLAVLVVRGALTPVGIVAAVAERFGVVVTEKEVLAALVALSFTGDVLTDDRFFAGRPDKQKDPAVQLRYSPSPKLKRAYDVEVALDNRLGALRRSVPPGS